MEKKTYEMRAGFGSAFENRDKKEDWHPEFRGQVMLPNGDVHYLDVKMKQTKAGKPWTSVKIGNKVSAGGPVYSGMSQHEKAKVNAYQPDPLAAMTDDIPF